MKCLYAARMCRFDLLRAVQGLARYMTKWTTRQDRELHQLMSYIHSSKGMKMIGWVSDSFEALQIQLYSDADVAGCLQTQRSTTGSFAMIVGANSKLPIAMTSKRQPCVSHSTPEAELVAMDSTILVVAMPAKIMWETLVPKMKGVIFW